MAYPLDLTAARLMCCHRCSDVAENAWQPILIPQAELG